MWFRLSGTAPILAAMKRCLVIIAILASVPMGSALGGDFLSDVLVLTGASDESELSEEVVESYEEMREHPLSINMADKNSLVSSGLFSAYQAASLLDYREKHGDVLSAAELAVVDGFGWKTASAMAGFVSFASMKLPGVTQEGGGSDASLSMRIYGKDGTWSEYAKAKYSGKGGLEVAVAAKRSPNSELGASFYMLRRMNRRAGKVMVGDFNARFGQGLALWSGFSMSGFASPETFSRRPSGISASWSYSGTSYRGVAADVALGRVVVSAMAALPGLRAWMEEGKAFDGTVLPALNVAWYGRKLDFSMTGVWEMGADGLVKDRLAMDGRICIGKVDVFGEVAADLVSSSIAGVAGLVVPVRKGKLGFVARYYPAAYDSDGVGAARAWSKTADEAGASVGFSHGGFVSNIDFAWKPSSGERQLKAVLTGDWRISKALSVKPKFLSRIRDYGLGVRSELRNDVVWNGGRWRGTFRVDGVYAGSFGTLSYLEAGYDDGVEAAYIRSTAFMVDDWDARIYSYERDVPGCFNIPAYYGRGYSLGFYASRKFRIRSARLKVNFRMGWTSYPWKSPGQESRKDDSAMVRLQLAMDF